MMSFLLFLVAFLLLLGSISSSSVVLSSPEDCLKYGFNSDVLLCSTCDLVQRAMGEGSDISAHCLQCCIAAEAVEIYAKAVLELDKRTLPFMPELAAVVKSKKELKLTVRNEVTNPRLLMYKSNDDDEPAETISVSSWSAETFKDYLHTHHAGLQEGGESNKK